MQMRTVSEVSRTYAVSTRMLRYYEKLGLITSTRKEGYAYRIYDEEAVRRLRLILILRKLRLPLKHICVILNDGEQTKALELLQANISQIDGELQALQAVRELLSSLSATLSKCLQAQVHLDILQDAQLQQAVQELRLPNNLLKEEAAADDLFCAKNDLLTGMNVRLVLLPPCTVAAYHFIGEEPEEHVNQAMDAFVRESGLYQRKPDARLFGFNHSEPSACTEQYGYEELVTIPDDLGVPAPFVKKQMRGGLYAAHTIDFPNFSEWALLVRWAEKDPVYCPNYGSVIGDDTDGCMEEHLNWVYSCAMGWPENGIDGKVDLLLPVKRRDGK